MALVNDLAVRLRAETDKYVGPIRKAQGATRKFAEENKSLGDVLENTKKRLREANPVALGFAGALAAVVGVTIKATVAQAEYAESLQKTSVRTNTTVEDLSRLEFAASQSGASIDDLTLGLRTVNRTAAESVSGNKQFAEIYETLGVNVRDANGRLKDGATLLREVADGLNQFETSGERAALGAKILGEDSIAKLLPLLDGGSEGINALAAESDALGKTISTDFANRSAVFLDNIGRLKAIVSGFGQTIAVDVLPILNEWLGILIEGANNVLPQFRKILQEVNFQIARAGIVTAAFAKGLFDLARGNLNEARISFQVLKDGVKLTREEFEELQIEMRGNVVPQVDETTAAVDRQVVSFGKLVAVLGDLQGALTFAEDLEEKIGAGLAQGPQVATDEEAFQATLGPLTGADQLPTLLDEFRSFFSDVQDLGSTAIGAIASGIDTLGSGLVDAAAGGKAAFQALFKQLLKDMLTAIVRALFLRAILSFLPGGFGSIFQTGLGATGPTVPAAAPPINLGSSQGNAGETIASQQRMPTVVVEEPSPLTRVRFVDDDVVPRLRERQDLSTEGL